MISSDEVAGWFNGGNAKGQLAQRTCSFPERIGAGFFASDNTQFKNDVFLAVNGVCWAVTPRLKASLINDLAGSSDAVKQGWDRMQSLFGAERLSETGHKDLAGLTVACWTSLLKFRTPPTLWTPCASTHRRKVAAPYQCGH